MSAIYTHNKTSNNTRIKVKNQFGNSADLQ